LVKKLKEEMFRTRNPKEDKLMTLSRLSILLLCPIGLFAQATSTIDLTGSQTVLEYTGQVTNVGTASIQVGYFNYVKGFSTSFSSASTQDESTALFTFFTSVNTTRNILNGSIRSVVREGTTTIYLAKNPADFANPDSFRSGTPIQSSSMRQQVLVDTITSGFTVTNYNVVNSVTSFAINGMSYQLGAPGKAFRTYLTGHLTATGPPSGHFGGFAIGSNSTEPFIGAPSSPAIASGNTGLAQFTITWGAPGVSLVEIHIGAPDGVLFTGGGSSGSATTGNWVGNGTRFFLQDVSDGKALTSANNLAQFVAIVR
jgi:hypothetical protein